MEDDTATATAFQATVQEICSGGGDVDFLAKTYTGEEISDAEINTVKGTALLSSLIINECHIKMEAAGVSCTKGNLTSTATAVNSVSNLTSERTILLLFPPDLIPRNSSPKPVLSTLRAAFSVVHQHRPEAARQAAKAIVEMTMTDRDLTVVEPVPWATILLPLPEQVHPLPSSTSLEQVSIPIEQLYTTLKGRNHFKYMRDHLEDKDIFRTFIILARLFPSTIHETIMLLDKEIHMAVAMIQVQTGGNIKTLTFSSPPMDSNSKAKNHVARKAVDYLVENHSNTMVEDDDDTNDQRNNEDVNQPGNEYLPKKIQKMNEGTTES